MPRGLGFLPDAVVIRSEPPASPAVLYNDDEAEYAEYTPYAEPEPAEGAEDAEESFPAGPSVSTSAFRTRRPNNAWNRDRDWHINPSGHGGRRGPPVFVKGVGHDLAATEVLVAVLEAQPVPPLPVEEVETKMSGSGVADWYLSLLKKKDTTVMTGTQSPPTSTATVTTAATNAATSTAASTPPVSNPPEPTRAPAALAPTPAQSRPSSRASPDWFIQRALANAPARNATTTPSSIAALVTSAPVIARPSQPQRIAYALGPENVGYARLAALGWAGGGLGRPEGWGGDVEARTPGTGTAGTSRSVSRAASTPADSDAVSETDADMDADVSDAEIPRHGPGRTAPVATVLKLDRLGLGRGRAAKRVTHTSKEIERAQRRARGVRAPPKEDEEMEKKEKIKWKEKDRRERESRARIAAALGAL